MTIDPGLLRTARTAGDRLAEAERQVLLARADYHAAIRRLHLAGASLREIAPALSLSHQRVQQVVRDAGGTWWQVWRRRHVTRDAVCTWCERPPSGVSKLIAGPNVYICDACVEAAGRVMKGARDGPVGMRTVGTSARDRCGFCSKRASDERSLVAGPANVCSQCLRVCQEILDSCSA